MEINIHDKWHTHVIDVYHNEGILILTPSTAHFAPGLMRRCSILLYLARSNKEVITTRTNTRKQKQHQAKCDPIIYTQTWNRRY